MPTALITGATAGIGAAFAQRLAKDGYDLVVVARDQERLAKLAEDLPAAHGISVEVLRADLSEEDDRATVAARLRDGDQVDLLVNNAGFAVTGSFPELEWDTLRRQHDVNVTAVLELTHAALPRMIGRNSGGIINVASVAGFMAGRGSTYPAGKAYVIALTEGLSNTVIGTDVRLLALCPGFVHTEFHARGKIDMSQLPEAGWLTPEFVVDEGLKDLARNAVVSVPSFRYKALVSGSRLLPRSVLRRATGTKNARNRT